MTVSMPKRLRALVSALALVGLLTPALAQRPSINAILLAREIIIVKGGSSLYEPMITDVVDRAKGVLLQTNPMLGKDLNEVATKVKSDAAPRVGELVNEAAKMYAARFTERELKEALAFYKSPLGQKIIVQEPAILDQSVAFAQTWAAKFSEQVLAQMRTEMKKRGHDL